jgi:hypothetical protein
MESLKASREWPYFLLRGHPIVSYSDSIGVWVFSATWRMMECTILLLLYRSSHRMMSSGDTRRLDKSMYPGPALALRTRTMAPRLRRKWRGPTFLLVHAKHDDDLVATNADELLDTSDTPPREFGEENHAVDVVVLEELDVGSHVGNLGQVSTAATTAAAVAAHGNGKALPA